MSQTHIVIQCRLGSQRLPGKALLPVAGMPLFELCVRRASNTGLPTTLAIPASESDRPLAELASKCGIVLFEGPEDDVLGRYAGAALEWNDDDIIVRLTADNCVPDGAFVDELVAQMQGRSLEYFGSSSPYDGLPYGLGAEAFTVRLLREANAQACLPAEREHVTPWIIAHYRNDLFRPSALLSDLSHMRCTVDTFSDYLRIVELFSLMDNPVQVSWFDLCARLQEMAGAGIRRRSVGLKRFSVLTFGTAQWGLRYGRANETGIPDEKELNDLVKIGVDAGINCIDTARGYGMAEERIGRLRASHAIDECRVVTKLDPLAVVEENWSRDAVQRAVDASIYGSCRDLNVATLDTVLLHRWNHYSSHGGAIWNRLLELQKQGIIGALGVSVQNPKEALEALDVDIISHIQLPFNILDYRWFNTDLQHRFVQRTDVAVHARSVFLQGILLAGHTYWPTVDGFTPHKIIDTLNSLAEELTDSDIKRLCLTYVLSHPWICSGVVGMETALQCRELVGLAQAPQFSAEQRVYIRKRIGRVPENVLNPATWGVGS